MPLSYCRLPIITNPFIINATATPETSTLSLHDALPISSVVRLDEAGARALAADLTNRPFTVASVEERDRKSTRLNSSHVEISYAVFCLKKKKKKTCIVDYTIE